jgi:hypothetical protein
MGRRSLWVAGLTAAAMLLVATVSAIAGHRKSSAAGDLVFTREDGSTFSFSHARVSCGKSRNGGKRKAIFIDSIPSPYGGKGTKKSYFFVEGVLRDVSPSSTVNFPHSATFGHPSGAEIFVFDRKEPAASDGNELSSDQEEASGKIVFQKARCRPRPRVAFTIKASLGSEIFGLPELKADGSFQGHG